jgi:hypothetical protein
MLNIIRCPGGPHGSEIKWDASLLVSADGVNLLGDNVDTVKENKETLIEASKEVGLEVNTQKSNMLLSL